jgi:predicted transposase/invertase (TIGR01784 family)
MLSEEERDFFKYLTGAAVKSDFTDKLDRLVSEAKHNAQWRHQFMTWEQEVQISYRNGVDDGKKQGIEQGIKRGTEQTKIETAKKMLLDNISIEIISKYTDLPIDEIQKLAQEK